MGNVGACFLSLFVLVLRMREKSLFMEKEEVEPYKIHQVGKTVQHETRQFGLFLLFLSARTACTRGELGSCETGVCHSLVLT